MINIDWDSALMAAVERSSREMQPQSPQNCEENGLDVSEMVQVFMVVRCYSCKTFQVQQVKKSNKWLCKVCNERQSVLKTYGKGTGKDCRKHVQKLNMLRAKREKVEDRSGEQHPPQDYASAFTTQEGAVDTSDLLEHPVVLGNTKSSRWTAFLSPNDEEEGASERTDQSGSREPSTRKSGIKRQASDLGVRRDDSEDGDIVCPYSSVNFEATFPAIPTSVSIATSSLSSAKSMYFSPDRYTKLDDGHAPPPIQFSRGMPSNTQSMYNLATPSSCDQREKMEKIKQDLQKFSKKDCKPSPKKASASGCVNPKLSSRWSQFMHEDDSTSEDEESNTRDGGCATSTHILASKSTIAQYTFEAH